MKKDIIISDPSDEQDSIIHVYYTSPIKKILRIDVMGRLEAHHMEDCERIEMDGVEYRLEDVYE